MPFPAMLQCAQCCTQFAALVGLCFIGGDAVSVVPLIPKIHSVSPNVFQRIGASCSQGTGLGPWILDPGWGCSAFRRCAVKGQWIPERNKKRRAC